MSKLGCPCGHVIVDQTDALPFKAAFLADRRNHPFWDWAGEVLQSYIDAAAQGQVRDWIKSRFDEDYAKLDLSPAEVLHDLIAGQFSELNRDAYECSACGRVLIETGNNVFVAYSPDDGVIHRPFDLDPELRTDASNSP